MRKSGAGGLLEVDTLSVALEDAGAEAIDLVRLERAISGPDADARTSAVTGSAGDLLAGIDDVSDPFSHWLTRERAAFRERFYIAASAALLDLTKFGRAPAAVLRNLTDRLLELDPEREQSYRVLLEAYGRNGMHDEAARIYSELASMLKREYGTTPSSETTAVARRVFATRNALVPPPAALPETGACPRVAFLMPAMPGAEGGRGLLRFFLEDVANELARYRSFVVLAPHSSFRTKAANDNEALKADYVVDGFVKPDRAGQVLALRMTECASAEIVWAVEFALGDRVLAQSFSLLSLRVASSLTSSLERSRSGSRQAGKDAYVDFLEGQRLLGNCSLGHLRRARRQFRTAATTAPKFAPPRARIAQTLYLEWIQLGGGDPELLNVAREQAEIAHELDPHDATGQWMKGTVALYQRDYETCEAALAEAETLAPNSPDLLLQFGDALSHLGRPDEGWEKFERALVLNPLPPDHYWWAGASIAFHQQKFAKTIELCSRLHDEEPVLPLLAASHAWLGDMERAVGYGRKLKEIFPGREALDKSATVTPDKEPFHRNLSVEGLRLAGVC